MHWWVHGPIWASLLVKCLIGFLFLWHVNCYKFQQAAERFENHEEISRLRCKTIQQCHKELVQTIEGPWVHFQPLTNTTCFYYLTLAHYEMEFSRMTLHVPLAKAVNLTDNTLEVTWTWAWAHSFQSLILCGKFSASFTFVQTYPRENLLLSFQLVRMDQEIFPHGSCRMSCKIQRILKCFLNGSALCKNALPTTWYWTQIHSLQKTQETNSQCSHFSKSNVPGGNFSHMLAILCFSGAGPGQTS